MKKLIIVALVLATVAAYAAPMRWLHCATEVEIRAIIKQGEDALKAIKPTSPGWKMTEPMALTDGSWGAPWPTYCEEYLSEENRALLVDASVIQPLLPPPPPMPTGQ